MDCKNVTTGRNGKIDLFSQGKTTSTFINDWKPYMDYLLKMEESEVIIDDLNDWKEIK